MWAFSIEHLYCHSHCLGYDQNVGKYDSGIDKALVAINGLEGEGRGDLGAAAARKEVMATLGFVVFRKISSSFGFVSTPLLFREL